MVKKTLIISLVYYPEFVGGAEVAVKEITDRSTASSFDMITLIGSSDKRVENIGNIRVVRVGFRVNQKNFLGKLFFTIQKYLFPLFVYRKGVSLMKENNYAIVWSIMANYAGFGALFLKLRFKTLRFLLTLQEGDPIPYIKRRVFFVYPLFAMIFKKADSIQTISHYLADFAKSMHGKNIHIIPNGVDIQNFTREFSEEEKKSLKEKLHIQTGDIVLVTTSRLVPKNGIKDVVMSLLLLPKNYKFLIIGDGHLKQELEKLVYRLHLSGRVQFFGFVPHKDIPHYFSISDIFIRTSLSEGLGNSFIEAMAFGLPVVATPVGGIVDIVEDGVTGIFVKPQNPQDIKDGVFRLDSRELFTQLQYNGKKLARSRYDWSFISKDFDSLFTRI